MQAEHAFFFSHISDYLPLHFARIIVPSASGDTRKAAGIHTLPHRGALTMVGGPITTRITR